MIVLVTNKLDYTADFLVVELQRRCVNYTRFNTEDFPQQVQVTWWIDDSGVQGYFSFPKRRILFHEIKSIWYRRPVTPNPHAKISDLVDREFVQAESQAALDGIWRCLNCFWVSHPDSLRKAELKLYQLQVAQQVGLLTWPTLLTNCSRDAESFCANQNNSLVYKPLRRGRIIRNDSVSLIYTNLIGNLGAEHLNNIAYAPVLLQKYVPKRVEIRVTVIGEEVFAVAIHSQDSSDAQHDWRRGDTCALFHEPHSLPREVAYRCVNLVKNLNLAFGAIDLILTPRDEYVFLEINPNGQWAWIQQICPDIPLRESLADLLVRGEL